MPMIKLHYSTLTAYAITSLYHYTVYIHYYGLQAAAP